MYDLSSGIQFKDVHFTYPSRPDMPIFQGLNLDVPAGSITAVVGPSGSGKSTLGSLLLRLYDPEQGQVIVGGHDVRSLSPDWLRGAVGTVHQVHVDNTSLVGCWQTFYENLRTLISSDVLQLSINRTFLIGLQRLNLQSYPKLRCILSIVSYQ